MYGGKMGNRVREESSRVLLHNVTLGRETPEGIELTNQYQQVLSLVQKGERAVLVLGSAGTGKSTLVRYLSHEIAKEKNLAVVAPTGVAALNVGGMTIHKMFGFPPRFIMPDEVREIPPQYRELWSHLDVLIIDEISMVRADLLDGIDAFLRVNREKKDEPFGGTQVVMVGDLFQLPPVVTSRERVLLREYEYKSEWFFASKVCKGLGCKIVNLDRVFRATDPALSDVLNKLRKGSSIDEAIYILNRQCLHREMGVGAVSLRCRRDEVDEFNKKKLSSLNGRIRKYKGEFEGEFELKEDTLPTPYVLSLKVGAQVMFTKNYGNLWVNGTIGIVQELGKYKVIVTIPEDRKHLSAIEVPKLSWTCYKYEFNAGEGRILAEAAGTYTQYPLMLAWAVTIHKSQGKTLNAAEIDFGRRGAFAPGQAYVALSRCRRLDQISLVREVRAADIGISHHVLDFCERYKIKDRGTCYR